MRMQSGELHVSADLEARVDLVVRMTRWNLERAIDGGQREDPLPRRALREDDAESRAIVDGVAVRRVVHLEHDIRAGLDQFRLSWTKDLRRLAGRVADEKVTGQRARIGLFFCLHLRSDEENARLLAA